MGRTKKTSHEAALDAQIGALVRLHRERRDMSAGDLAERLDLSPSSISAIESGRHSLPVHRLLHIAAVLGVRPAALMPVAAQIESRDGDISDLLVNRFRQTTEQLDEASRYYILSMVERMVGQTLRSERLRELMPKGWPVSIEGVDGFVVGEVSRRLRDRLIARGTEARVYDYDFDDDLWSFMFGRVHLHTVHQASEANRPLVAVERTLLFACERLYRQSRFMSLRGTVQVAIAPFFSLAAGVYQRVEGVPDISIVRLIDELLLPARPVIILRSDPAIAAARARRRRPEPGTDQFFSPYKELADFHHARDEYDALHADHRANADIHIIDADGDLDGAVDEIMVKLTAEP